MTDRAFIEVRGARENNLKDISLDLPKRKLTVFTGVSGSGKSSLVFDTIAAEAQRQLNETFTFFVQGCLPHYGQPDVDRIEHLNAPIIIDQKQIRQAFARTNNVGASLFSFNSDGSCPNCNGLGVVYADLAFMEGISSVCEICEGKRFKPEVLGHHLRGRTISDVLDMSVEDALAFFSEKKVRGVLQAMNDVGLGYLKLGQPLSTVSGGEGQRLKLATELHKQGSVYVMDEPTTGLHLSDIGLLMRIIDRLVDAGNTVILIEHHLGVIRQADWIIDLGPEGGSAGGEVLIEKLHAESHGALHLVVETAGQTA
jgi:excinuclease UvrABC ATPase subunit